MSTMYIHGFELDTATLKHAASQQLQQQNNNAGGDSDTASVENGNNNDQSPDMSSNETGALSPHGRRESLGLDFGQYDQDDMSGTDPLGSHRTRRAQKQRVYRERIKQKRQYEEVERTRLKDDNQRLELQNRSMKKDIVDLKKRIAEMEATQRLLFMSRLSPFFAAPAPTVATASVPTVGNPLVQTKQPHAGDYDAQAAMGFPYSLLAAAHAPTIAAAADPDFPMRRHSLDAGLSSATATDPHIITAAQSLPYMEHEAAAHTTKLQKRLSVNSDTAVSSNHMGSYNIETLTGDHAEYNRRSGSARPNCGPGLTNSMSCPAGEDGTNGSQQQQLPREQWESAATTPADVLQPDTTQFHYPRQVGPYANVNAPADGEMARRQSWAGGYNYYGAEWEVANQAREWDGQPMAMDAGDGALGSGHRGWFANHGTPYERSSTVW